MDHAANLKVMEKNSQAHTVRKFLKEQRNGILSTVSKEVEDFPYGSVCPYMMDHQGRPVFLISTIAEHTKNIAANDKACLTVMDERTNPRLEGARVSYMGRAQRVGPQEEDILSNRYLRFFPEAQAYFKAHGFHYYRIEPKRIRYIEGFGKIYWVEAKELLLSSMTLIDDENGIIAHVNKDHRDILEAFCKHYFKQKGGSAQMIAVDSEGFTVRAHSGDYYFSFHQECTSADQVRAEMIRMAKESGNGKKDTGA